MPARKRNDFGIAHSENGAVCKADASAFPRDVPAAVNQRPEAPDSVTGPSHASDLGLSVGQSIRPFPELACSAKRSARALFPPCRNQALSGSKSVRAACRARKRTGSGAYRVGDRRLVRQFAFPCLRSSRLGQKAAPLRHGSVELPNATQTNSFYTTMWPPTP